VAVANVVPARWGGSCGGELAEEVSAVGGPYEAFGDVGVAFIVDLESPVVHQPGPGSFDNPAPREGNECVGVDAVDGFCGDVVVAAVTGEGGLEPGVVPHLGEPFRFRPERVDDGDPSLVVAGVRRCHVDRKEQPVGVDNPERFAPGDLLPGVIAPGQPGDGRGATNAACIDHPGRRVTVAAVVFADQAAQAVSDAFPGAVTRPGQMQPVHGVPVRVAGWQRTPLASGRADVQDGVHDLASIDRRWASHLAVTRPRLDEIGDQFPLEIRQITVRSTPRANYPSRFRFHQHKLDHPITQTTAIHATNSTNYPNRL
jgi:hypothetical protein